VQKLDELESKDFTSSGDLNATGNNPHIDTKIKGYVIKWYVTDITSNSKVVEKRINMIVSWNDGKSKLEVTRQVSAGAYRTST